MCIQGTMNTKDPNYAVKVEQAIANKYGKETVVNPKSQWDDEKEKEYLDQLKRTFSPDADTEDLDKEEIFGVFMTKFECCFKCYIQWVEGREERWKKGWRPKNENH